MAPIVGTHAQYVRSLTQTLTHTGTHRVLMGHTLMNGFVCSAGIDVHVFPYFVFTGASVAFPS